MKLLKLVFAFGLSCGLAQAAPTLQLQQHPLVGKIWDMKAREFINEQQLQQRVNDASFVLLGETHDNQQHHDYQLKLFQQRVAAGKTTALVMEQYNAESQPQINTSLAMSDRTLALSALEEIMSFSDKHFYRPMLEIAYDKKLPVVGANIARRELQTVIRHGYDRVNADELKRLQVEIVWDERREQYMRGQMGGVHCGQLREEFRIGMVRAQRLRDAWMADNALAYVNGAVAIVGREHARWDVGMPLYLRQRAPDAKLLSVAMVEVSEKAVTAEAYDELSATGDAPYDIIWFTPRAERTDPCAGFSNSPMAEQPTTPHKAAE